VKENKHQSVIISVAVSVQQCVWLCLSMWRGRCVTGRDCTRAWLEWPSDSVPL